MLPYHQCKANFTTKRTPKSSGIIAGMNAHVDWHVLIVQQFKTRDTLATVRHAPDF